MLARHLFNHPRYLALFIMAIIAIGLTSYNSMGRQEDPTITPFVAKIQTFFPGASPARVEALITKPIEDAIREVPEVDEITSTSASGVSVIMIEVDYRLSLAEINQVWSELRDIIASEAASFPKSVQAPTFDDDIITAFVKIVAISSRDGRDIPASVLRREAELFADAARRIPLTKRVMLYGLPEEEVLVEIDETKMARLGLSIDSVTQALRAADAKAPAGKLTGSGSALTIELTGEFTDLERLRAVQLRALADGRVLRLDDIASIRKTEKLPASRYALSQGKRSILVGVEMNQGYQVDNYSSRFDTFLADYRRQAPAGLTIDVSYDQSGYTEERLTGVASNLLMGIGLVLVVLLVSLGWRAALVVAVVLPLCTMLSMIALLQFEVPIHQMSLTGLVVALGLLVDGSIVMADEVRKRLLEGLKPVEAMAGAVTRLRVPLISSTITTVLAFLPMAILKGPAGDFLGSIAISVIVMLVSSMFLALTVTPVLAARWLPSGITSATPRWWQAGWVTPRVRSCFIRTLDWSMRHPIGAIVLALSLPITGFITTSTLTNQFFPGTDRDQFYLQITLPDNAAIEDSLSLAHAIDEDLRAEPLVRRVDWSIGESAPAFYYNMRSNKQGIAGWMEALVLTRDEEHTDTLIRRLQKRFDERYRQAQIIVRGIDQGPPVAAPLEVLIIGPNIAELKRLGALFRQRLGSIADVTHTQMSMKTGAPKVMFDLHEDKLRRVGLERNGVADTIDAALRGRLGGELLEDTERLPVRSRLTRDDWSTVNAVSSLRVPIANPSNGLAAVPLLSLGEVRLVPDDSPISRDEGERVNRVQGYLTRGVLPEEALKILQSDLQNNPIALPMGYRYSFGGDADERAGVVRDLQSPMGMIVVGLIATILLTFNSWRLTAVALLVCLCSFGLSFLALAIFRYPLGIQALIGVIGSIGVSINAAIIILTALQQDTGASHGDISAIRQVVLDASRHIVSTTVTTFGGFLPLILEGSQFWPPFAMAIAGGVLLSTVISFYLVPPLFLLTLSQRAQLPGDVNSIAGGR